MFSNFVLLMLLYKLDLFFKYFLYFLLQHNLSIMQLVVEPQWIVIEAFIVDNIYSLQSPHTANAFIKSYYDLCLLYNSSLITSIAIKVSAHNWDKISLLASEMPPSSPVVSFRHLLNFSASKFYPGTTSKAEHSSSPCVFSLNKLPIALI